MQGSGGGGEPFKRKLRSEKEKEEGRNLSISKLGRERGGS